MDLYSYGPDLAIPKPMLLQHFYLGLSKKSTQFLDIASGGAVVEPPNLMPPRSTCLPLDTKYSRENTKLRSSIGQTPRENPKIHIFPSGSQIRE